MIPAHNDWPIRNREQQSDHIYYTLLQQMFGFAVPFTSLSKLCKNVGQTHSSEPSRNVLTSLHPILICKVTYILSTGGIALSTAFNSFSAVVSGY
jgi:hypothetical protein